MSEGRDNIVPFRKPAAPLGSSLIGLSQRQPPGNVAAEQALLGAILANNKAYDAVSPFLQAKHFLGLEHQTIFRTIAERVAQGELADAVTLRALFVNAGILDALGGAEYLATLLSLMGPPKYAADYARTILDGYVRRELIAIAEDVANTAFGAVTDLSGMQTLERGHAALMNLQQQVAPAQGNRHAQVMIGVTAQAVLDAADRMAARGGGIMGLSTGMPTVDDMLDGLERGTQTILAGRPTVGKSALGFQWTVAAARRGDICLVISQEMSAEALTRRALSALSGVPVSLIKRGEHGRYAEELLIAFRELKNLPLMIRDGRGHSPAAMAGFARECKQKLGRLDLMLLDHLQIAEADEVYPGDRRAGSKAQQIGQVTGAICRIAKDFDCAALTLSQLNRDPDKRDDHRPNLGDLKGSGDIEQDAEKVMFLYREEMYLEADAPQKGPESEEKYAAKKLVWQQKWDRAKDRADLIIAKNRDGSPGTIKLRFHGPTTSFSEATS